MHNGASSHNHSGPKNGNGNGGSSSQNRSNPPTPAKIDLSHITYFKCQKTRHCATNVLKQIMEMTMEVPQRSPTPSPKVR